MEPDKSQGLCLDKGYDYEEVRQLITSFGFTAHLRSWGKEQPIAERILGWFSRFRGLLIPCLSG